MLIGAWFLILLGIFIWLFVFYSQKGFDLYSKYGLPNIFLVFAIIITWISVLGYQMNFQKNLSLEASNIVFVLDVSKSMVALDYGETSRLWLWKNFIKEYIAKHPNNKYALTIFAWDVTSVIPFTSDKSLFLNFLDSVDEKSVFNQWSNFFDATSEALSRFIDDVNGWAIVMLSDFEPTDTKGNLDAKQKENLLVKIWELKKIFQEKNIVFFWIWLGSVSGNNIIAWYDFFWVPSYLSDTFWKIVVTKLDTDFLTKMAQKLSGETFIIHKKDDIKNVDLQNIPAWNIEISQEIQSDISRYIMMITFVFFLIYLILFYYFDKKWK